MVLEFLVEDARLYLEGSLRGFEAVLQVAQRASSPRGRVDAVPHGQEPGRDGEYRYHADKHARSHATGTNGRDLAVGCQTAESDEDADQHAHGQGDHKSGGQGIDENFRDAGQRGAVADHQLKQPAEVAHEDDEREQQHAQQSVRAHLFQDVAGQNSHNLSSVTKVAGGRSGKSHP